MELGFGFTTIVIIIAGLYLLSSIKILAEYERGVIFRLGRLLPQAKGPGLIFVFAPLDRMVRISLRQEALEIPPQDIITRDNVTLKVNAVIVLRVIDPNKAVVEVSNYAYQTSQFAQTTLRRPLCARFSANRNLTNCWLIATKLICGCRASSTRTLRRGA